MGYLKLFLSSVDFYELFRKQILQETKYQSAKHFVKPDLNPNRS